MKWARRSSIAAADTRGATDDNTTSLQRLTRQISVNCCAYCAIFRCRGRRFHAGYAVICRRRYAAPRVDFRHACASARLVIPRVLPILASRFRLSAYLMPNIALAFSRGLTDYRRLKALEAIRVSRHRARWPPHRDFRADIEYRRAAARRAREAMRGAARPARFAISGEPVRLRHAAYAVSLGIGGADVIDRPPRCSSGLYRLLVRDVGVRRHTQSDMSSKTSTRRGQRFRQPPTERDFS